MSKNLVLLCLAAAAAASAGTPLRELLKASPFKIVHECYVNGNWELFVMNADGSSPVNLTHTPKVHEHYPQVSPDGTKISFLVDQGEGRDTVRSLYVMDIDGRNRRKLVDYAREQFWSPDGKVIGYLPQEYPRFDVKDFNTKGMNFYDLATGKITPHPNSANLYHLYTPNFSPNGKWIVSTLHAGMGFSHAILLIEAHGDRVINLKIPGCRPALSPDGKQIAWGTGDHEIAAAPIDLDAETPAVGKWRLQIKDKKLEIYHVKWSPDGRLLTFSRGPASKGDVSKPGTFTGPCELIGVYAAAWNLCAASAEHDGEMDLDTATGAEFTTLTTNDNSNKQPVFFVPRRKARE